jgi:hypothetical protein
MTLKKGQKTPEELGYLATTNREKGSLDGEFAWQEGSDRPHLLSVFGFVIR